MAEDAIFLLNQVPWGIELYNDTFVQNDQPVVVDHSLQSMCDCAIQASSVIRSKQARGYRQNNPPVNKSEPPNSSRIVAWIFWSVAKSILLVASSSTIIELRRKSARAIAINCRWPCEKFDPPGDTWVSSDTSGLASNSVVDTAIEEPGVGGKVS